MAEVHAWHFGDYQLDLHNACLWRGTQALHLPPKAFTVLYTLVQHAGQLVTKEALLQAAWPDTAVSEAALTICLSAIRKALGETAQAPRFIQTVHRRGYRFLAAVSTAPASAPVPAGALADLVVPVSPRPPPPLLVGYDAELARIQASFVAAQRGRRQLVLVAGEAGMGKTTVVDAFLARLTTAGAYAVAWGQCLAHYGVGEAYLPVLDALGRLGRGPVQARLLAVLRQFAPTWLAQLPALHGRAEGTAAPAPGSGITPTRMLRELAEALDALTLEQPLVLVLEDLHWSDYATLDLLTWLARRREAARLLVVGTYRPAEVIVQGHPLQAVVQDLARHQQCVEVRLDGLSPAAVDAYLAARLPGGTLPAGLAAVLAERTAGQPLFMVQVVDAWLRERRVVDVAGQWEVPGGLEELATDVPASVRQFIEQQLAGCRPEEQRVLEAASVVGETCAAAAVASGLEVAVEEVETWCEALVQRGQFLRRGGVETWPDGTATACYKFLHAVYHDVVYAGVSAGPRARLHQQIGLRKEAAYGAWVPEVAAELAVHFAQGYDPGRAVRYRQLAAQNALRRYAYQEAIGHLRTGLTLLQRLPESVERAQQELDLHIVLGPALRATRGLAALEVEQTYARARELCAQMGDTPQLVPTLWGLCWFYLNRGILPTARELGEQLVRLVQHTATPFQQVEAHEAFGTTLFFLGDYAAARTHLEQAIALAEQLVQRDLALHRDAVPLVQCLVHVALALWCLGYPTQAVRRSQEALALAQEVGHLHSLALTRHYAAYLYHRRREVAAVQTQAETLLALMTAQEFPLWMGVGVCWRGWALTMQGQSTAGLAQLQQGQTMAMATGQELSRPFCLLLLAEAAGHAGQVDEGLRLLAEALVAFEASGRGDLLAETYRLRGEFLLRQAPPAVATAEIVFQQALTIARRQQARAWELRVAMSLARLWQRQGKQDEARALLAPIYGWFTEGFDTADLQEARALLHALGGAPHDPRMVPQVRCTAEGTGRRR